MWCSLGEGLKRGESGDLVGLSIGTIANARIVQFPVGVFLLLDNPRRTKTPINL